MLKGCHPYFVSGPLQLLGSLVRSAPDLCCVCINFALCLVFKKTRISEKYISKHSLTRGHYCENYSLLSIRILWGQSIRQVGQSDSTNLSSNTSWSGNLNKRNMIVLQTYMYTFTTVSSLFVENKFHRFFFFGGGCGFYFFLGGGAQQQVQSSLRKREQWVYFSEIMYLRNYFWGQFYKTT